MAASATVISVLSGNVFAKAADVPVNQMLSKNAVVVEPGTIEKVDVIESMSLEEMEFENNCGIDGFVEVNLRNTADITYEIIYNDATMVLATGQEPVELEHFRDIVDIKLKEHQKFSDGSCKTTYYEGRECTICNTIWRGDVIKTITETKCPH